jgi:5-methylcytosine-specific restriction endonuclease McrA
MPQDNKDISHTKACRNGHVADRDARGECRECIRIRRRKADYSELAEDQTRPCPQGHIAGRNKNGTCLECLRIRRKATATRRKAVAHVKYARSKGFSTISADELEVYLEDNRDTKCKYCGDPASHIDHIVPLSLGGEHSFDNIQMICRACNMAKGTLSEEEYLGWVGRLINHRK